MTGRSRNPVERNLTREKRHRDETDSLRMTLILACLEIASATQVVEFLV